MVKVGTDIIVIQRVAKGKERFGERFLKRYLNPSEYSPKSSDATLAGLWAAKEAAAKALGCGIGKYLSFHDIQIQKDEEGAPQLHFNKRVVDRFKITGSTLSISHDGGFAIAVAIVAFKDS